MAERLSGLVKLLADANSRTAALEAGSRAPAIYRAGDFSDDPIMDFECRTVAESTTKLLERIHDSFTRKPVGKVTDFSAVSNELRALINSATLALDGCARLAALQQFESQRIEGQ